jgi:Sulfotransferase family
MQVSKFNLSIPPIFVVGPLRSGSTLLRLLLDHHSHLNFFGEFEGAVSQAVDNQWPDIDRYWEFVETDRQMRALNLEIDPTLDYEALVRSFLYQLSQRTDKPMIGASVHSRIDLLPRLWPDARFIHILRDPRDVANSAIGMGWVGNVHEGTRYWLDVELRWDRLCDVVPEQQRIEVRYEELVESPEAHLTQICRFLGLDYEAGMLDIEKATTYAYPDPAYSFQWRKKLSAKEVGWVEYQCREKLLQRGYELSGHPIDSPGIFQLASIKLQNRYYRATFNIRSWGLRLWLAHVTAKRFGSSSWKRKVKLRIDEIVRERLK